MKRNIGGTDQTIRILIASVIAILYTSGYLTGRCGIILLISAGIFILSSVLSICPLYTLVGMSTCVKNTTMK